MDNNDIIQDEKNRDDASIWMHPEKIRFLPTSLRGWNLENRDPIYHLGHVIIAGQLCPLLASNQISPQAWVPLVEMETKTTFGFAGREILYRRDAEFGPKLFEVDQHNTLWALETHGGRKHPPVGMNAANKAGTLKWHLNPERVTHGFGFIRSGAVTHYADVATLKQALRPERPESLPVLRPRSNFSEAAYGG